MNTLQLLENKDIRNFIYDDSDKKVLIGSRRIGKTYALCLSCFRSLISEKNIDVVYIVPTAMTVRCVSEIVEQISEEYGYDYSVRNSNNIKIITINSSKLFIGTIDSLRGYRIRPESVLVDEPSFIKDSTKIEDFYLQMKALGTNCKLALAGSLNSGNNSALVNMAANGSVSRHVARLDNTHAMYEELRATLSSQQFKREILCEI